jgi:glycosyltransferase involved in cell wall biosynthesis
MAPPVVKSVESAGRADGSGRGSVRGRADVALLTGGQDRPYACGLAMSLLARKARLDVIGSEEVDCPEFHCSPDVTFLNLRGNQRKGARLREKAVRVLAYYGRLIRYAATARPRVFHILWNNKFEWFDRTLLLLYYRCLGKKIVLTAHNVNAGKRDAKDSGFNRITLRIQYRLADHIFVHTRKMKAELCEEYGVARRAVTVLTHPINDAFPDTSMTPSEAKRRLGIGGQDKAILFFGRLEPYKGLEHLIEAVRLVRTADSGYKLIIAGEPKKGSEQYFEAIRQGVAMVMADGWVIPKFEFIPDAEAEIYFKAADVLALPYKDIFQSGVLFLGLTFGLPLIATDVGSFDEVVLKGRTGFLCRPGDPVDLARAIEDYFSSDLFRNLDLTRRAIRAYARREHSWEPVGCLTNEVYLSLS